MRRCSQKTPAALHCSPQMPLYPVLYQPLPWRDHSILLSLATHLASLLLNTTRCTSWNYDPALSLLKKSKKKKQGKFNIWGYVPSVQMHVKTHIKANISNQWPSVCLVIINPVEMLTSHAAEIKWSYKVQPVRWVQHPSLPTIQLGRPYSGTAPVDCIQIWIKP